ncbi:MAG: nickel pincer cofactor biosynthesis protein LarB [Verrucomicrobiota bacterium]|nr:nickel pincer cofactor biosynthesis protein LarB [Verrucomicrobiota bacterium]
MNPEQTRRILEQYKAGTVSLDEASKLLLADEVVDLGFAAVDTQRAARTGFPEVIFGSGKSPDQILKIAREILAHNSRVLVTRVGPEAVTLLLKEFPAAVHHEQARCVTIESGPLPKRAGEIVILAAGTSDLPVAEEAAVTAEVMGNMVTRIYDVGVAGIHRLFRRLPAIRAAHVVVAVAGMEGALPSVVAGLISRPIIAVPTSIGYGANFGGLAALLAMLNSCGSGVTVVNIDNGFGAGFAASQINALANSGRIP